MGAHLKASLSSKLQRKDPSLPVYLVIPGKVVATWKLTRTTVVEGTANGHTFGRRNIKAWGKGSEDWFLEFTSPFCKAAGLSVGDSVLLVFIPADMSPPDELEAHMSVSESFSLAWSKLTDRQRREMSEHVRAAKTSAARERRAKAVVGKILVTW